METPVVMETKSWLFFSAVALLMWGVWGFLAKVATLHIGPRSVFVYAGVGVVIVGLLTVALASGFRPEMNAKGAALGILTGAAGTSGAFFFFLSMSRGKASVVVTLTALYPLITLLLSYAFLGEQVTLKQAAGVVFAIIAMALLST